MTQKQNRVVRETHAEPVSHPSIHLIFFLLLVILVACLTFSYFSSLVANKIKSMKWDDERYTFKPPGPRTGIFCSINGEKRNYVTVAEDGKSRKCLTILHQLTMHKKKTTYTTKSV